MAEVEQTGPTVEDEDLEDGEIETDDEEDVKPVVVEVPPPVKPADSSPSKISKSNKVDDQEDFATSLERQLAQALGKPAPEPAQPGTDSKRPKEKGNKDKNRKRRRRNESPARDRDRDRDRHRKVQMGYFHIEMRY